ILASANSAFAAEQYRKAEKEYKELLRLEPSDPMAIRQLGILYYDQEQVQQAYPLLQKSAELQPNDIEVQLKFGLILLLMGEHMQARDAALRILEQRPGHEEGLMLLASAALASENVQDRRNLIESLRAKDEDRPGYHLALGLLDIQQGNEKAAE